MDIAVIENEYNSIENAFNYLNARYFNNEIVFDNYPSSQSIGDLSNLVNYHRIFVDIDLSTKSEMDGFSLLKSMEEFVTQKEKIVILTGLDQNEVEIKLRGHNLKDYSILIKPLDFRKLRNFIPSK